MNTVTDTYVTKAGTEFTFEFETVEGNYHIKIVDQPSYGSRPSDAHTTHRLLDDSGKSYVCFTGSMPTISDAKNIAGLWADQTEKYILTGEQFPEGTV